MSKNLKEYYKLKKQAKLLGYDLVRNYKKDPKIDLEQKTVPRCVIKNIQWKCPSCGEEIVDEPDIRELYCSTCGQMIDWSIYDASNYDYLISLEEYREKEMNIPTAIDIFYNLNSDDISIVDKINAISIVLKLETKNSITKKACLSALKWMLGSHWRKINDGKDIMKQTHGIKTTMIDELRENKK